MAIIAVECSADQEALHKAVLPLLVVICPAAIAISFITFIRTLRRRLTLKPIIGMLAVSAAKLSAQLLIWAAVWIFLHLGGIGLKYRFGSCHPISALTDHSFIIIPAAIVVAQLIVDLYINERYYLKNRDTAFIVLHLLSWLAVAPIVFIPLSILEFLVRHPY
jgi:hypothetical protein